jgi:transcriptional regulator with XRE-family HTH domain
MPLNALGRKVLLPFGTQRRIARRLNVSTSYVSMIVNGGRIPRTGQGRAVAVAISRALGMKLSEAFAELAPQSVQESAGRYVATTT